MSQVFPYACIRLWGLPPLFVDISRISQVGELVTSVREQLQLPENAEHELGLWFDGKPLLPHQNLRSSGVSLESNIFGWIEPIPQNVDIPLLSRTDPTREEGTSSDPVAERNRHNAGDLDPDAGGSSIAERNGHNARGSDATTTETTSPKPSRPEPLREDVAASAPVAPPAMSSYAHDWAPEFGVMLSPYDIEDPGHTEPIYALGSFPGRLPRFEYDGGDGLDGGVPISYVRQRLLQELAAAAPHHQRDYTFEERGWGSSMIREFWAEYRLGRHRRERGMVAREISRRDAEVLRDRFQEDFDVRIVGNAPDLEPMPPRELDSYELVVLRTVYGFHELIRLRREGSLNSPEQRQRLRMTFGFRDDDINEELFPTLFLKGAAEGRWELLAPAPTSRAFLESSVRQFRWTEGLLCEHFHFRRLGVCICCLGAQEEESKAGGPRRCPVRKRLLERDALCLQLPCGDIFDASFLRGELRQRHSCPVCNLSLPIEPWLIEGTPRPRERVPPARAVPSPQPPDTLMRKRYLPEQLLAVMQRVQDESAVRFLERVALPLMASRMPSATLLFCLVRHGVGTNVAAAVLHSLQINCPLLDACASSPRTVSPEELDDFLHKSGWKMQWECEPPAWLRSRGDELQPYLRTLRLAQDQFAEQLRPVVIEVPDDRQVASELLLPPASSFRSMGVPTGVQQTIESHPAVRSGQLPADDLESMRWALPALAAIVRFGDASQWHVGWGTALHPVRERCPEVADVLARAWAERGNLPEEHVLAEGLSARGSAIVKLFHSLVVSDSITTSSLWFAGGVSNAMLWIFDPFVARVAESIMHGPRAFMSSDSAQAAGPGDLATARPVDQLVRVVWHTTGVWMQSSIDAIVSGERGISTDHPTEELLLRRLLEFVALGEGLSAAMAAFIDIWRSARGKIENVSVVLERVATTVESGRLLPLDPAKPNLRDGLLRFDGAEELLSWLGFAAQNDSSCSESDSSGKLFPHPTTTPQRVATLSPYLRGGSVWQLALGWTDWKASAERSPPTLLQSSSYDSS